jgi:hypothetical protein
MNKAERNFFKACGEVVKAAYEKNKVEIEYLFKKIVNCVNNGGDVDKLIKDSYLSLSLCYGDSTAKYIVNTAVDMVNGI